MPSWTSSPFPQNIRVDVPCRFTVGISTEPDNMTNAAERLLGLSVDSIQNIATDILFGQLRLVIATMDIEEINADRDKFLANVSTNVEAELRKIGLKLINVNVTDIRDESGYIEALGKEAAAKAINDAKKSVAEQNRFGEIGKAEADRDKDIRIAETMPKPPGTPASRRPRPTPTPSRVRTSPRSPSPTPTRPAARRRPRQPV